MKFGTRGSIRTAYTGYFFMSDSSSLGSFSAKFPMSKGWYSHSFHSISAKLICKYVSFYGSLNFLLTQDHMGLDILKRYSYSF